MKIVHVINNLNTGGAEKLLLEILPVYKQRGIIADLLLLDGTDYPFLKELKKQNCCKVMDLGKGSVYNPLLLFKLFSFLKKYNVVHVHLFPALYWVSLVKKLFLSNIHLVYTEHNTSNRRRESKVFRWIDRFIYSEYSKIITIADKVDVNLKKHLRTDSSKFKLIHNGVNIQKIKEAQGYKKEIFFEKKDCILIQVSSFRFPKDQETLIRALIELPDMVKLALVGEGAQKSVCENLVKKLKLQNRVQFLGVRMDVPELLKMADMVVLSSKYEGLSLSSIEGLASGKPFIASNVPGLNDVVGGAGILFEQGNSKNLALQILKLLDDSDYYNQIVEKCLKRAQDYTIETMIDKHIELYKSLLKN